MKRSGEAVNNDKSLLTAYLSLQNYPSQVRYFFDCPAVIFASTSPTPWWKRVIRSSWRRKCFARMSLLYMMKKRYKHMRYRNTCIPIENKNVFMLTLNCRKTVSSLELGCGGKVESTFQEHALSSDICIFMQCLDTHFWEFRAQSFKHETS